MKMAVYYYGEDTFAARQAIFDRAKGGELAWLDAAQLKQNTLSHLHSTQAGLFGTTMTVLRDPSSLPKTTRDSLARDFTQLSNTIVLWDRAKPDKRGNLWRAVKKTAEEFTFLPLSELAQDMETRASEYGTSLASSAAALLVNRLGRDRWRLYSELDRLCLLSREITEEIVRREVQSQTPTEIFTALDALVAGRSEDALRAVQNLLQTGASEFYILAMLAYQYRVILLIASGFSEGLSEQEIARQARLHPYVVKKNGPLARNVTINDVTAALTRIAATDFAIKQGKINPRDGLMMLLLGLVRKNTA